MSPREGAMAARRIIEEAPEMTERDLWPEPHMGVLRLHRRKPPNLPIEVFGPVRGPWITNAGNASA